MKWRIPYILVLGLVLAGIVHIAVVLMVPKYGTRDAWAFLSGRTELFSFTPLESANSLSAIAEVDPYFSQGVCRFDLNTSALKMLGPQTELFWSASVFDETGTVIYSLNDRTAIDQQLDLLIVNALQTLELREAQPEEIETSVVIEANIRFGFVIVRIFRPDESRNREVETFLKDISCEKYEITADREVLQPEAEQSEETQPEEPAS